MNLYRIADFLMLNWGGRTDLNLGTSANLDCARMREVRF